jgi:hypothetical protein
MAMNLIKKSFPVRSAARWFIRPENMPFAILIVLSALSLLSRLILMAR